jgi:LL-diaminopimelate aminotransferase
VGTWFAGGECHWMPLLEENGWLPDLDAIPEHVARAAKVMWLNYPNNPTGAIAGPDYFEKVVEFAARYDIAVLHDASYTEVAFDGFKPTSFLQTPGAMEVGMEFHSLSKSYNMTGWRVGMAAGNADLIEALMIIKSNLDSGIPQAVQHMAIEAIKTSDAELMARNAVYQRRRDRVIDTLQGIGLSVEAPRAGLYVWARVPKGFTSAEFTALLLDEVDLVVTPGNGYGPSGEGYVRFSLTIREDDMERGLQRMATLEIPPK